MQVRFLPGAQNMIQAKKIIKIIRNRLNFALASGTITILGIMVGLYSGTYMKSVVIGGIITVAIADAFSDALGFHVSREIDDPKLKTVIWLSTASSFFFKFFFILTFIIPAALFSLKTAIIVNIIWGFFVIGLVSWNLPLFPKTKKLYIVIEHLFIASIVITLTFYAGKLISSAF